MENRVSRRNSSRLAAGLLASASALVFGLGATPAFAQDTSQQTNNPQVPQAQKQTGRASAKANAQSPSATNEGGQAIVVTGIRASLQSARNIKKNSNQMVDAVSAQDIGALPDRSVSEALQRIPGVTLQRTDQARDPARLSAEGGAIFIRGLSWTKSEFNGRDVFSANNGRTLGFEDVPADLLSAIEVYKNPTADQIEGGIGGIVNLVTRKPFDQSGQLLAADIDYNYADLRKKGFWSGYALWSDRWSTSAGEFGLLLSGSLNNIGNRTDEVQTGGYNAENGAAGTSFAGNSYYFPNSLGLRRIDWTQRRMAFDGSAQWRPADNLTFTAEAIYSQANHHDIENVVGPGGSMPAPGTAGVTYTFDSNNNVISGHIPAGTPNYGILSLIDARHETGGDVTKDYSFNAKWDVTPRLTVSGDIQYVASKHSLISMTAFDEFDQPVSVDFNFGASTPWITYTLPGNALAQQGNYFWSAAMDHRDRNDAHQWAYKADAEYRFEDGSFLKSFRFGARATDQRAISRGTTWNWSLLSYQDWMGLPPSSKAVMLNQEGSPANPGLPAQSYFDTFNNFFRGSVPALGGFWVPTPGLVANPAHAYTYLQDTKTQGWGWTPLPPNDYSTGSVNNQKNDTIAGYGLLSFANDSGPFRFDGNVGVRIVRTRNDAGALQLTAGFTNLPALSTCQTSATAQNLPASICTPLANLYTFLGTSGSGGGGGGSVTSTIAGQIPTKSSYTEVLPTLNLRFFLQDNMFLRFAAGEAVTPPTFAQLAPTIGLGANFVTTTGFPTGCNLTATPVSCPNPFRGTGANPTLKPIKSTQLDASWEYYFGRAGQLSAAVFYKRIKDYIFAGNQTVSVTSNGQTLNFDVTQLQNGSHGTIKGFELAYQQFYDFLPRPLDGFGIGANLTFVDSKGGRNTTEAPSDATQVANSNNSALPLEGLSKWSYNVQLMYSKYGIDARLAYNWREHYLLTTSAANINQPVWSGSYGQLDGSIFYDLTNHFKVGFQATNILASKSYLYVGYADRHPFYSVNTTDRRYALVLRAKF